MTSHLFETSINKAIDWLFRIQDDNNFGWSWIQDISPNAQNTAEVVYTCCAFSYWLSPAKKELLSEAVAQWLLHPRLNCFITIDYVWNLLALLSFHDHLEEFPLLETSEADINHAISRCVYWLLDSQNPDGGYSDNRGEDSTAIRSAIVLFALSKYRQKYGGEASYVDATNSKLCEWLLARQNPDGGWGNVPIDVVHKQRTLLGNSVSNQAMCEQYLSNAASTGYAIMALSSYDIDTYYYQIARGVAYLKTQQKPDGSFPMFVEVGVRKDVIFTFRHFGTAWALSGLLCSKQCKMHDPEIFHTVYHLLQLQDQANGGWKCTPESDIYTWSTANVLAALSRIGVEGYGVLEQEYSDIYWDWWDLRLNRAAGAEPEAAAPAQPETPAPGGGWRSFLRRNGVKLAKLGFTAVAAVAALCLGEYKLAVAALVFALLLLI